MRLRFFRKPPPKFCFVTLRKTSHTRNVRGNRSLSLAPFPRTGAAYSLIRICLSLCSRHLRTRPMRNACREMNFSPDTSHNPRPLAEINEFFSSADEKLFGQFLFFNFQKTMNDQYKFPMLGKLFFLFLFIVVAYMVVKDLFSNSISRGITPSVLFLIGIYFVIYIILAISDKIFKGVWFPKKQENIIAMESLKNKLGTAYKEKIISAASIWKWFFGIIMIALVICMVVIVYGYLRG